MARATVADNKARLERHSVIIHTLQTDMALVKRTVNSLDRKLDDDFIDGLKRVMKKVDGPDNGHLSLSSWRREQERLTRELLADKAKREKVAQNQESEIKKERRKWIYGIVFFIMGALVNYGFILIGNSLAK